MGRKEMETESSLIAAFDSTPTVDRQPSTVDCRLGRARRDRSVQPHWTPCDESDCDECDCDENDENDANDEKCAAQRQRRKRARAAPASAIDNDSDFNIESKSPPRVRLPVSCTHSYIVLVLFV